jgi:uncharacterized protein YndB with AHSA1/START domain
MTGSDRIEKQILLRAPRSRVWRALTDAEEFGSWFGMKLERGFEAGSSVHGRITSRGYEHLQVEMMVERLDPEDYFSYRWHPHAIDPATDYSNEPTTLVEFRLEDAADGTTLTVVESGFDQIPPSRRDEAFRMNDRGWSSQIENFRRYVEK